MLTLCELPRPTSSVFVETSKSRTAPFTAVVLCCTLGGGGGSPNVKVALSDSPLSRVTVTFFAPADCGPTRTSKLLAVTLVGLGVWLPNTTVMPGSKKLPDTCTVAWLPKGTAGGAKPVMTG